jgi:SAM-dependent methyltransferase
MVQRNPMTDELNPQARQMADESMVRNLDAQARVTGVDVIEGSLAIARRRCERFGERVGFEARSVFGLGWEDGRFDLTVCRHLLQAVPHAERVVAELARVTRPGGRLHLVAEDYGMIHFPAGRLDADAFWREGPGSFAAATGTDLHVGRRAPAMLARLGLRDITVDYVVVDTLRVERETFARILVAWRDGYSDAIAGHTRFSRAEVVDHFDAMIEVIRDPLGYAVWMVPVVAAVIPG